jgi:hypothetical protein
VTCQALEPLQFTCFTSTKVQILAPEELRDMPGTRAARRFPVAYSVYLLY